MNQENPSSSEPIQPETPTKLELQILSAMVDGKRWSGQVSQDLMDKIPYQVMVHGTPNEIAVRVAFICGLKVLRGPTRCTSALLKVLINGEEFFVQYNQKLQGWQGAWITEETKQAILERAAKRVKSGNA